jgi:hypothetical protein
MAPWHLCTAWKYAERKEGRRREETERERRGREREERESENWQGVSSNQRVRFRIAVG